MYFTKIVRVIFFTSILTYLDTSNVYSKQADTEGKMYRTLFESIESEKNPEIIFGPAGEKFEFIRTGKSTCGNYLLAKAIIPPGAGQAILDANTLTAELISHPDRQLYDTLQAYEDQRLAYTTKITLCDRAGIIDNLVREVDKRSQGKPFSDLSELITPAEIDALSHPRYLMD